MLPSERSSQLPKSVLRSVWTTTVLKAGLGVQTELEVRDYFHNNPYILLEFDKLNLKLLEGIQELQLIAINGLKHQTQPPLKSIDPNFKRQRLE